MRLLSGIPVMVFIVWAVIAMPHAAYGESYEQLKQQVQRLEDQRTEDQRFQMERANFDESERIYEQSEKQLWQEEDRYDNTSYGAEQ